MAHDRTPVIEAMQHAIHELRDLRRSNDIMYARLNMFDNIMSLFHTTPDRKSESMSPDVVWKLEQLIEKERKYAEQSKPRRNKPAA